VENTPLEKNNGLDIEELINQHSVLFVPDKVDDSSSLVQPHAFDYVSNFASDATLVENSSVEA